MHVPDAPPAHPEPGPLAVVVPHTHWDREWYSPFETMRFALVQFFDELIDVLEREPGLPAFLLDGQAVILEDYTEIRPDQRARLSALVGAGRLRPGPFYVQPDEFHVSGEALVRNLLIGCRVSREYGHVMREGYLPDTFGHVHQLPQILRGFGIDTFYAMRGFGDETETLGSEFLWRAPDGSRVRAHWLAESYSNAAVLTGDPETLSLHHGILVGYDRLPELLERLGGRSSTGVLLLLNGGDHLRVQQGVPEMVASLNEEQSRNGGTALRLGGLEEFRQLTDGRPAPEAEFTGELRHGRKHDVFDGIGSTRTPLKRLNEATESKLSGIAERLDALATLTDGRSSLDSLRYAWRELVKNYAHDSICGCSVDEVHEEMNVRFARISQVAEAVTRDALARVAHAAADRDRAGRATAAAGRTAGEERGIPVAVVNPSAFPRSGRVSVDVVPDPEAPLGERRFGWTQGVGSGGDWKTHVLVGPDGQRVPFTAAPAPGVTVEDTLDRRKELHRDRLTFHAADVPALAPKLYRLLPAGEAPPAAAPPAPAPRTVRDGRSLTNDALSVTIEDDGTLTLADRTTGSRRSGLLEILDDGDAGDEYGFGPLPGDRPLTSRHARWEISDGPGEDALTARAVLTVPSRLLPDRSGRDHESTVALPLTLTVRLPAEADRVEAEVSVDNAAEDHRLRLRVPTGVHAAHSVAESAFGVIRRDAATPAGEGWRDRPTGAFAMRRFAALEDDTTGLAVFTEGLHEYTHSEGHVLEVTLLRSVGWMARTDHPLRPHKVGPELPTPAAQCPGPRTFRIALRPYGGSGRSGDLYRTAEEFALPLLAHAVHSRPVPASEAPPLGLAVTPAEAVVSAVKTAEDRDGLVVRVFNSSDSPVTAALTCRTPLSGAEASDMEEQRLHGLDVRQDGRSGHSTVQLPLEGGRIATLRLRPEATTPRRR
ncbi:mannosylglycerate hydrolase [Streptomyces sp. WMMB 714]|uniref:alpha-mannosidase n=1 Tax=Streptomyces sp. WMMB 714 TaxID=1286822 RepID=UPI0005F85BE7|nr:glycoside hydrolase family 38 C-terminal domain-containing protein [Streptomyces sp. WMMB 714]SCK05667.1 mannosylglycerate hydrolase [Streptomyces sp. WMMB 714]